MSAAAADREAGDGAPARRPAPREACPSLVSPMATGDGLIARILPADGEMSVAALAAIAAAAVAFGNGIVEVTQRGSLQVRGLSAATAPGLERAVMEAGAVPPSGPPVHVGPLAGIDLAEIADPRPLASLLRARLPGALPVDAPAKLAVVVDGGGRFTLDGLSADLRLVAVRTDGAPAWLLETDEGPVAPPLPEDEAAAAALAFVAGIHRPARRRPRPRVPVAPVGVLPVAGPTGRADALGVVVPYGFTDAGRLASLVAAAEDAGAATVRLAPGHGLVFVGKSGAAGGVSPAGLLEAAADLGFIVHPDDPRLALSVCAGAPACGSGEAPTRPLADAVVAAAAPLIAAGGSVHLSGCAKGCARATPADLTIVGTAGRYGLVRDGRAGDVAVETVSSGGLLAAIGAVRRTA